jgi:hypothetical protein
MTRRPANHASSYCQKCGAAFASYRPWQRFCSSKCRDGWHNTLRLDLVRQSKIQTLQQASTTTMASS